MRKRISILSTAAVIATLMIAAVLVSMQYYQAQAATLHAPAVGTGFLYQGRLVDGNSVANGSYDFQFELFDAANGGNQIGGTVNQNDVSVTDGRFTVLLDFGAGAFDGNPRWLEISVRQGDSTGSYDTLSPRQRLAPAPYAIHADNAPWGGLLGIPGDIADGDDDTTYSAGTGLTLNGTTFALNTGFTDNRYWALDGNAGTTFDTNFLGTTDSISLTLKVNGNTAMRIAPGTDSGDGGSDVTPNLIGGSSANIIPPSVEGAVIAGGGHVFSIVGGPNSARNSYATVSGGHSNTASGGNATIGGGIENFASGDTSTIGGGVRNLASGLEATIGGGDRNVASGNSSTIGGGHENVAGGLDSTIGGGKENTANGDWSTVPGGDNNHATGLNTFAAGQGAHADHDRTFVWNSNFLRPLHTSADDQVLMSGVEFWLGNIPGTSGAYTPTIQAGAFLDTSTGAYLSAGGTWTNGSDRASKDDFQAVDGQAVLEQLADVPIQTWRYKAEAEDVRHMGPVAQDFAAAFGLGQNDKTISTIDADGVSLAAIQALYELAQEQQDAIKMQQEQIEILEARIEALEQIHNE